MREIKFRAWDKNNSRMIDLKKVTPLAMAANLGIDGIFIPFAEQYELMQYTGLKDKNGVEIYEGDIIQMPHCKQEGYEIDENGMHKTVVVCGKDGRWESPRGIGFRFAYGVEVVGNVYDNPELLEGRQPE